MKHQLGYKEKPCEYGNSYIQLYTDTLNMWHALKLKHVVIFPVKAIVIYIDIVREEVPKRFITKEVREDEWRSREPEPPKEKLSEVTASEQQWDIRCKQKALDPWSGSPSIWYNKKQLYRPQHAGITCLHKIIPGWCQKPRRRKCSFVKAVYRWKQKASPSWRRRKEQREQPRQKECKLARECLSQTTYWSDSQIRRPLVCRVLENGSFILQPLSTCSRCQVSCRDIGVKKVDEDPALTELTL